ncbi:MAG: GNAT family N-acetyltransferase [Planctomycetota bacterium]
MTPTLSDPNVMTDFAVQPPVPEDHTGLFQQRIVLSADGDVLGEIVWTNWPHQPGVAQLLHVEVAESCRRAGHGTRLLGAMVEQAKLANRPLRRIVAMLNQTDVNTRAWLQRSGFVHIDTIQDVAQDGIELMCLVRTFD